MQDAVWLNANLATLREGGAPYGEIRDGAIAVKDGRIAWVGPRSEWKGRAAQENDARGAWITPGLVDCHTHLVYAGNRADEFEQRLKGATYEEIARAGGGIQSTVRATRAASDTELAVLAARRLAQWIAEGVTVVEIKSGYGLDTETEMKMLRVARLLGDRLSVRTTFLGAHALPEEFKGRQDAYIALVCGEMLPAAAPLSDAVDAFCEGIAFTVKQTARVFAAAKKLGLPVKLHADQLSDTGGAQLAAQFGALSADHLEYTNEAGVETMAKAGTVAVLLPGAYYFLRETHRPPVGALRRHRVPIAIATDHNPGSSPLSSPLLAMNMACTLFNLTPEEALAGVTRNGARALGMQATHGTLETGKSADFALWKIDSPAQLAYEAGANPNAGVVRSGELLRATP
ncbi:MAG TPA: imidazolonepropionase [Burkholderiales bacterium]|nr:imidazolonepropionase [Burkholderiales bacterium]